MSPAGVEPHREATATRNAWLWTACGMGLLSVLLFYAGNRRGSGPFGIAGLVSAATTLAALRYAFVREAQIRRSLTTGAALPAGGRAMSLMAAAVTVVLLLTLAGIGIAN